MGRVSQVHRVKIADLTEEVGTVMGQNFQHLNIAVVSQILRVIDFSLKTGGLILVINVAFISQVSKASEHVFNIEHTPTAEPTEKWLNIRKLCSRPLCEPPYCWFNSRGMKISEMSFYSAENQETILTQKLTTCLTHHSYHFSKCPNF